MTTLFRCSRGIQNCKRKPRRTDLKQFSSTLLYSTLRRFHGSNEFKIGKASVAAIVLIYGKTWAVFCLTPSTWHVTLSLQFHGEMYNTVQALREYVWGYLILKLFGLLPSRVREWFGYSSCALLSCCFPRFVSSRELEEIKNSRAIGEREVTPLPDGEFSGMALHLIVHLGQPRSCVVRTIGKNSLISNTNCSWIRIRRRYSRKVSGKTPNLIAWY